MMFTLMTISPSLCANRGNNRPRLWGEICENSSMCVCVSETWPISWPLSMARQQTSTMAMCCSNCHKLIKLIPGIPKSLIDERTLVCGCESPSVRLQKFTFVVEHKVDRSRLFVFAMAIQSYSFWHWNGAITSNDDDWSPFNRVRY